MKSNVNLYDNENASKRVKNEFVLGDQIIFGCRVHIDRIDPPYKYIQDNGKPATMSARYHGYIEFPDGSIWVANTHAKRRAGAYARECGLWVSKERDAMDKLGKLYEVTNRRTIED